MIRKVGIVANLRKPDVSADVGRFVAAARERELEIFVAEPEAVELGLADCSVAESQLAVVADLLVSFGGDGTFLRGARVAAGHSTPLLGINLGSLGFLAEVRREEIDSAVAQVADGDYILERRRRVKAVLTRNGDPIFESSALNDIVLNMGPVPRAIDIEIRIDGTYVGRYLADGLIVATPTGSTAYSLSAGGPIVDPTVAALILTPICPHTLAVRPVILEDSKSIEVILHECASGVMTADGQSTTQIESGDRIEFRRDSDVAYLLRLPRRNLFEIIEQKLNWGGSRRIVRASTEGDDPGAH